MKRNTTRQTIWLRTIRKYHTLLERHANGESLQRKIDILRRRLLRMNRVWKLGIATASLMVWLNAPAVAQFPAAFELSDLDENNGFVINGISSDDYSGFSVSSAGDINGDGIDDILIGANRAAPNGNDRAGESYVVFGKSTAFVSNLNLSALDGSNGFILNGIDADDQSGVSVSSAGDINGDGINDLLIGAPRAAPNGNNRAGESYVIFGKSTPFASSFNLSTLDGSNGFILNGIDERDYSGTSVSSAGDVNGDGIDDIIIGAIDADPNGNDRAGESYVVFGKSTAFPSSFNLSALDGSNGFILNGIDAVDRSGRPVSSAGDLNGDGLSDLIIGARFADPNGSSSGESYVVFGKSTIFASSLNLSALDGSNGFVINGVSAGNLSGTSAASAGDVNGDGVDDIIIGAAGNSSRGRSYVVFGKSTGFTSSFNLSTLDGSNGFTLDGIDRFDISSFSVSSAGDINGDGIDDIIIGAHLADPNGGESGESYVVFGKSTGFISFSSLSTLNGSNGFVLNGIDARDYSGFSVSSAGDINGDGIDDIIIGARLADPNGNSDAGESYVVFGCDRTAEMSIQLAPTSVEEDGDLITFTYTFAASVSPCFNLSIGFSVSGTATFNDDYYLVRGSDDFDGTTGTVIIPAGQTSVELIFQAQQDAILEPDETIIVTIETP